MPGVTVHMAEKSDFKDKLFTRYSTSVCRLFFLDTSKPEASADRWRSPTGISQCVAKEARYRQRPLHDQSLQLTFMEASLGGRGMPRLHI